MDAEITRSRFMDSLESLTKQYGWPIMREWLLSYVVVQDAVAGQPTMRAYVDDQLRRMPVDHNGLPILGVPSRESSSAAVDEQWSKYKPTLSVAQASEVSGVSQQTIRQWTHVNGFPAVRAERRIYISRDGFKKWLEEQKVTNNGMRPNWPNR